MLPRLTRAAASFTAVLAAYLVYVLVAVPWIEPTLLRPSGSGDSSELRRATHHEERRRILASLFPEGAWELNDSRVKVLETEYGMLLLLEYTPKGDQLEIKPCTVVLELPPQDASRAARHLAIQAPQGAVLEFEGPIDPRRAEISRPVGGRLQGEVRIFSPPTAPGASDALEIVTQNLQMRAGRVWTPHEVSFRFGRSYGAGRGLTIDLLPASAAAPKEDAMAIAGVRTLELARLEKAHLEAPPLGLFSDRKESSLSARQIQSAGKSTLEAALQAPLEITCKGPFKFDFQELVASFEEEVDVRRLHDPLPPDQMTCQLLEFYFASPRGNPFQPVSQRTGAQSAMKPQIDEAESGALRKVVAVGRPLVVRAPSVGAFVQADRLEYDLQSRRLRLENRSPLSTAPAEGEADSGNAILEHQGRHFEAPRLQYEMGPPGRLGKLWAAGPGCFRGPLTKTSKHLPELPEGTLCEISWRQEIHLRPHEGLHVASVTGGAKARIGDIGGFEAAELHVWLHEEPAAPQHAATGEEKQGFRIIPDRLLAQGGVTLRSPRISGAAGTLQAWFEEAPPASDQAPSQSLFAERGLDRNGETHSAFDIRSDLIQLRVLRQGDRATLEDATLRGNVLLRETQTKRPGEKPLIVSGELVELRGAGGPAARLHVLGDPQKNLLAEASSQGMAFSGWRLHVDQRDSRVWIEGPGKLTLPMRARSFARFAAGPLPAAQAPSSIEVSWRKGLDFDGQRVLIEEQVETRGEGQVIHSDSLQAFLARPLDLTQSSRHAPRGERTRTSEQVSEILEIRNAPHAEREGHTTRTDQFEQAEVARLLFGGRSQDSSGVVVESQTIERGVLQSFDKAQTRNLDLDVIAGRMQADGPGRIESVRQGGFHMPGSPLHGSPLHGPAPSQGQSGELSFVRVDFQAALTGHSLSQDLSQWQMTFHGGVETIVGPVSRWEERLNADSPSGLGPRGMLLTSRELSITQMGVSPAGDPQLELAATGRPHIESLKFRADGDRLSYDGPKGLLVLEGGREKARFWRRTETGAETNGEAERVQYWPRENHLEADLQYLDLTGLRNAFGPQPLRR